MATIKPFRAYRPGAGLAARVAALPYDVYDRAEAKAVVEKLAAIEDVLKVRIVK